MPIGLLKTDLPLGGRRQGKVRDVYDAGMVRDLPALAIVATDRLSAFDVVLPDPIPGKGVILTQLSQFWFDMIQDKLGSGLSHHIVGTDPDLIESLPEAQKARIRGRLVVGRKTRVVPIECVVRGYLAGSGWAEYKKSQTVCGQRLPAGLRQCEKLPEPIFTPASKAETGHDENISIQAAGEAVGHDLIATLKKHSIDIYTMASEYAASRGIIIADTKFEFGIPIGDAKGDLAAPILIDEVLTPDSSRFWPAASYSPGRDQESFDKQFVRNYLQGLVDVGEWDKTAPGPSLPQHVIEGTTRKYLEAYRLITGKELAL